MKIKMLMGFFFSFGCVWFLPAQHRQMDKKPEFSQRVILKGLNDPWDIVYGPDDHIWVTESKNYTVDRIDPKSGKKQILLDLSREKNFTREDNWPQGGLMGMALHPQLLENKPYVYLAYVYYFKRYNSENGCKGEYGGCYYMTKIVRYRYDKALKKLEDPEIVCDSIPGSSDHNGGRLAIANVAKKPYLFYTVGDMGAGQFSNAGRSNHAQDPEVYEGKILRLNLEPDDNSGAQQWIPDDNPFNAERQNAVWSVGHRNPQGIASGDIRGENMLYSSEHGPFGDDEVNKIEKGRNYGHPLIIGYNDNNYNGYAAGVTDQVALPGKWNTTYPLIREESENARALGTSFKEPIAVLAPMDADTLKKIFTQTVTSSSSKPDWEAVAPSSIAVYTSDGIPGWKNSLLVTSLKQGSLIRLPINAEGSHIFEPLEYYFKRDVRYRDIAVSKDGQRIYLSTDNRSVSSNPSKEDGGEDLTCKGCIMEFKLKK